MPKTWRIEFRDSLRVSPETGRSAAKAILDRFLGPGYELPQASNKRNQAGGWECGIFASNWVERSLRELLGEGRLPPISEKDQVDRANKLIQKLKEAIDVVLKEKVKVKAAPKLRMNPEPVWPTLEDALEAAQKCSKCIETKAGTKGCRVCMGEWLEHIHQKGNVTINW